MQPDTTVNRTPRIILLAAMAFLVTACGGGGGGGSSDPTTQNIGGGGVKGPLANAVVMAYAFDASAAGFKGAVIDTGTTNASAKITGLDLTLPLAPPYILEFTSVAGTTDITTTVAPVITTMRTVLTQALIDTGDDVYATPLTTMATDLAVANAGTSAFGGDDTAPVTAAEFVSALPIAASQVTSTLGFGIDSTIDIFDTPPLVDDTTDTTAEQTSVATYRAAVEAVTAIVYEMDQQSTGTTPDAVLNEITADLADGAIDGTVGGSASTVYVPATLDVLDQDPASLPIPNEPSGKTVGEVESILIAETATTGTTTDTAELDPTTGSIDTVVEPAETDPDLDGDGVLNSDDAYPNDATADTDTDGDGAPDVAYTDATRATVDTTRSDADDDNDGWLDTEDDYTTDATAFLDPALDRDSDGALNDADPCPLDATDACVGITDTDGDGVEDASDNCPTVANPSQTDSGGSADGDACDTDIDGDGTPNTTDAFPTDAIESADNDGDGIGDVADLDDDNDGISDIQEGTDGTDPTSRDSDSDGIFDNADAFPNNANESIDTDGDCGATPQFGATDGDTCANNFDTDDDGDGLLDTVETATGIYVDSSDTGSKPLVADTDGDTLSDGAEVTAGTNPLLADSDADGTNDNTDNCPVVANADQLNTDGAADGGNACDTDDDNDNVSDTQEATDGTDPLLADTDGDTVNDDIDVFPLDGTETVDTDGDTVGDNGDNCPAVANTDQLNTDGDANGNACDVDDDNDNVSDTQEAIDGTDPLLADTDGDTVNDDIDVFPLDGTETVDTDGDTVGDNGDNCPAVANTDQLNTDGDANGNACDTDDDNDGVSDTDEATQGTNPLLVDTDGDGDNDGADNCPTVSNADQADTNMDGVGDACAETGATGVWKTSATVASLTPLITDGCLDYDPVSTVTDFYMTMTQSGPTLTAKTVWGDSLSGTINTGTGAFTLDGTTTFTDPFTGDVETDTISVTGTTTSATTWTGTVTVTNAYTAFGGSSVDQCTETNDLASTFVYKHVAGEDYNGVYGLELADDEGQNSFAIQIEVTGSTMAIHVPLKDPNETFTNTAFDPNTGFFSFDIDGVEDYDDGVGSEEWHDKVTGILLRDPTEATLPTMALQIDGYWAEYDAFGGSTGGGSMTGNGQDEEGGYGKRQSSTGFTRSSYFRSNATNSKIEAIFMGMSHPPLKTATATSELYVEVLDGATRLCTSTYTKRYTNADYKPAADMTTEAFQSQFYSFVTCDTSDHTGGVTTHQVTDGMNYIVRIMDTGADGAVDGGDDTAVAGASMTITAAVNTAFFAETPGVNSFALNGAETSKTMKQGSQEGVIELFGFFDVNEDMAFSWTGLAGAERYSLHVKEYKGDIEQTRFTLNPAVGTARESITIPAGTLDMWDGNVIRVRARKDGTTSEHRALATSKWVQIQPGIRGLFNVELGGAVDQAHDNFQVWINGDMGDGTTGFVSECNSVNHNWMCNGGSIDYTTNTVSLNMTDLTGGLGAVTLDLAFDTGSSANGTVSSTDVVLTPSQTDVRLVNPELAVRSLQPSGGIPQQTMAVVVNTLGGATGFDKAVFKREDNGNFNLTKVSDGTSVNSRVQWCETDLCGTDKLFLDVVGAFQMRPTDDGVAQPAGHFLSDRTAADWGLVTGRLDATTYKSVWTSTVIPSAGTWVFKNAYTAPNASVLVTPIHNQVTVNGVAAGVDSGDVGAPIDVTSQPAFGLTWTGTGTEWQIRVIYLGTASGIVPAGAEVRSEWMADGHADLTEGPVGTWTWTNGEGIALQSGDTVRVQIRARDGSAFTMLGAQRMGATDDTVYLTMP